MNAIRLVVFDDRSPLLLDSLTALLNSQADFDVVESCSAEPELIQQLKKRNVTIAVLVWHDIDMMRFEFIEKLRRAYPELRIILICTEIDETVVQRAIRIGVQGVLTHETPGTELVQAVYTLRNGHDYLGEAISRLLLRDYVDSLRTHTSPADGPLGKLSRREVEVLKLWADGHANKNIADSLFISVRTVESHKNHIMQKLKLSTTVDLMKFAIRTGITSL